MPTYVALGSSFASGPGIEPIIDAGCGRSGNNYAHLVAERLGYDLVDVSSGGATVAGLHSVVTQPWSEEYQTDFLEMHHRVFDRVEAVVGEHVWNFADFATASSVGRVAGNKKGVFTRDRKPKAAAFALRRRWRPEL